MDVIDCPPEGGAPPPPISFVRLSLLTALCGNQFKAWSLVVSVRYLLVVVSSWRLLTFSQNFACDGKARQKYCEKGAPSGVVGSCPRMALPISSGHAVLVVCKMVARNL